MFSFRDDFGQWDPKRQRPELWTLYNGRIRKGEHVRVFPLSNWTELDVWQYIAEEKLELPSIYFAHEREVFERDGMLYALSDYVELIDGEEPFEESVRYRTVGDMTLHRRGALDARRRSTRWSPRSPPRASPSAARPAPTTASPRPRWRTASARATSSARMHRRRHQRAPGSAAHQRAAAVRHRRLGRRRQVDADRPAAVRLQVDLRGPARARRADLRAARRRLREPRAADRRPARRARAGHHDRRRLPLLRDAAAQVHHRRHARATSSTRATWSPAPRPRISRSCWSTRARASSSRPAATPPSPRCCGSRTCVVCVNKMDLVDYDEEVFDAIVRRASRDWAARLDDPRRHLHPDLARCTATTSSTAPSTMPWYDGAAAALPPRARARSRPTATSPTCASRSSG